MPPRRRRRHDRWGDEADAGGGGADAGDELIDLRVAGGVVGGDGRGGDAGGAGDGGHDALYVRPLLAALRRVEPELREDRVELELLVWGDEDVLLADREVAIPRLVQPDVHETGAAADFIEDEHPARAAGRIERLL